MLRHDGQAVVAILEIIREAEVRPHIGLAQAQSVDDLPVETGFEALVHRAVERVERRGRNARRRIDGERQQLVVDLGAIERDIPDEAADPAPRADLRRNRVLFLQRLETARRRRKRRRNSAARPSA